MARLFITSRELNFISDITKEVVKDVIGQKVYYFPISELKTKSHAVYNEAVQKIFDNPIELDATVAFPEIATKIDKFGIDRTFKIEAFFQWRDLKDKGINISIGDYFSYGELFYEIDEFSFMRNIFGQVEHLDGVKLTGVKVRESQFKAHIYGPTDITYTDKDAIQKTFVQQRGYEENSLGKTNDRRDLIENGVLEKPLSQPREVSNKDNDPTGSRFYDED